MFKFFEVTASFIWASISFRNMETRIRGILEKEIEVFTNPDIVRRIATGLQGRGILLKSIEDCLYGVVVGWVWGRFATMTNPLAMRGKFTDAAIDEFWGLIEKRTMYIKGRITVAMGK